jgi:hypothetical protein
MAIPMNTLLDRADATAVIDSPFLLSGLVADIARRIVTLPLQNRVVIRSALTELEAAGDSPKAELIEAVARDVAEALRGRVHVPLPEVPEDGEA